VTYFFNESGFALILTKNGLADILAAFLTNTHLVTLLKVSTNLETSV
jgi:hypothetical protein